MLTFKNHYEVFSSTPIETSSLSLVSDPEAGLEFNLDDRRVVLIVYTACGDYQYNKSPRGQAIGIELDGANVASQDNSPAASMDPVGQTVFWVGILESGRHTVKGIFKRNYATIYNARIDQRRLTALIFEGSVNDFRFIRSQTLASIISSTLQDDTDASFTFRTDASCKALILYSICNYYGTNQSVAGKKIAISTDGIDGIAIGHTPSRDSYPDHSFIAEIRNLPSGEHTIKGRFASHYDGYRAVISERQFGILLFSTSLETDFVESVSTSEHRGTDYGNDVYAVVNRTIFVIRSIFALYSACFMGDGVTTHGMDVAINIDDEDYEKNTNSPNGSGQPNSASMHLITQKDMGPHTVTGRYRGANWFDEPPQKINVRTLCVLWFPLEAIPKGTIIIHAKVKE